jgi:hypothetical protein
LHRIRKKGLKWRDKPCDSETISKQSSLNIPLAIT